MKTLKDERGQPLAVGDIVIVTAGYPPGFPMYIVREKAEVLKIGRKNVTIRSFADTYGTRTGPPNCVRKVSQ